MSTVKFNNKNAVFFNTLRDRVNNYFSENNIKPTGNVHLFSKTAILLSTLFASYLFLVFFTPESIWVSLAVCTLMGFIMAGVGFNVLHDGAHGSYSQYKVVNEMMAYTLNLLGGSSFIWKQKHNINHHSYTNIEGMDDDIDIKPFIRVSTAQKKYWYHRFQHIYGLLLYGLTYLFWIYYNDFKKYFLQKVTPDVNLPKMSFMEHLVFWVTKLGYIGVFVVLPSVMVGFWSTLIGYGVAVFVTGVVIAVVFQLAHVHGEAEFFAPTGDTTIIENEWAIHQVKTTSNFATKNKIISWFSGGLNYQIEHHLLPRISHIHYPQISKIVRETCREFNIKYSEFPTLFSAIKAHLVYLRKVGVA